jgi:hypothetical protein
LICQMERPMPNITYGTVVGYTRSTIYPI